MRTGDIATIDPHGYVRIVDRMKDLIKFGGEWISSQALELCLMAHPFFREAAVIGRTDEKWQERPVGFVALHNDTVEQRSDFSQDYKKYMGSVFSKWQISDEIICVSELPKGKTAKIDKMTLRRMSV